MGLLVTLIAVSAGLGASLAAIMKLWPERDNLTVDAAQKAVQLLRETLDELSYALERALTKVVELQEKLDLAIERSHELEQLLETERHKVAALEQRVAELRVVEIDQRHP